MSENIFDHSIEAENQLMSILIKYPDKFHDINALKVFMLSSKPNQQIFEAIADYRSKNQIPTYDLLLNYSDYYSSNKKDIDPQSQLEFLRKIDVNPDSFSAYEDMVVNSFKGRTLISITSDVYRAVTAKGRVDEVISDFRVQLDRLSENLGSENVIPMSAIAPNVLDEIRYRIEHKGTIRGVTTGYKELDAFTSGMSRGNLWIICGRPGQGKTADICNFVLNQASKGYKPLIFSLEMSKQELGERMVAIDSGVSLFVGIRSGLLGDNDMERIVKSVETIKDYPIYVDTKFTPSIEHIENTIRKYKKQYGIDVAYVDYIQILAERDANSTHELGRYSRRLKLLAGELDIAIVMASQLNRLVELRDDKHPILSDLRQSGNLEEDADVVIGLYREKYYQKHSKSDVIEHIIMKQRNGPTGTVMLRFNEETNRVSEMKYGEQTNSEGKNVGKRTRKAAEQEADLS